MDPYNNNATSPRIIFRLRRTSKYPKYSNITTGFSKQCGNASDSPRGCMVNYTSYTKEKRNVNLTDLTCSCNVITVLNVTNEDCCHHACCKYSVANIASDRCTGNFLHYNCDFTDVIVQDPTSVIVTDQTDVMNITESTKEMEPSNIPPSTTIAYSGSAPARRQQDLALVAAAILIYIHGGGQENFL